MDREKIKQCSSSLPQHRKKKNNVAKQNERVIPIQICTAVNILFAVVDTQGKANFLIYFFLFIYFFLPPSRTLLVYPICNSLFHHVYKK